MRKFIVKASGCAIASIGSLAFAPAANASPVPVGNLFYQNGPPVSSNVSIAINNPQNMGGGSWVGGSNATYPIGGASPVLDGDPSTNWNAGTFSGGGMLNVAMTQGYYSSDASSFTNVPFSEIGTIRIYSTEAPSGAISFPQQISVAYTTTNFNPGNGYSYNSGTLGVLPWPWGDTTDANVGYIANIIAVNGMAPSAPADSTDYSPTNGWVAGAFTNYVSGDTNGNDSQEDYMDLTLDIPAGATSVMVSFGQDNSSTGNGGGVLIGDIQAYAPVPEPASLGFLALGAVGLLTHRRRR